MIDVVYTPAEVAEIHTALTTIEAHLERLPRATKAELRRIAHAGIRNDGFCADAIEAGIQNPDVLPRGLDLEAVERDRVAREVLAPIAQRVQRMNERLEIGSRLLGADIYGAARAIYKALQEYGRGMGLNELIEHLASRFKAQGQRGTKDPSLAKGAGGVSQ
jgi:hypothetical protein